MTWIRSQSNYWTAQEAAFLFPPLTHRQVRDMIRKAQLEPAGKRPGEHAGRPAPVYDADVLTVLLATITGNGND